MRQIPATSRILPESLLVIRSIIKEQPYPDAKSIPRSRPKAVRKTVPPEICRKGMVAAWNGLCIGAKLVFQKTFLAPGEFNAGAEVDDTAWDEAGDI